MISGPIACFTGRFDTEYFHWFTDYLPRVFGLEAYERRTGEDLPILLPSDPPSWLKDSLRWAGVDPDRRVEYPSGRVHVEELVVPSMHRHAYDDETEGWAVFSPTALERVRDRIREQVAVTPPSEERIYISRSDSDERRVVNEDTVMAALESYGFERYIFSEYTLTEQVELFASAGVDQADYMVWTHQHAVRRRPHHC